MTKAIKIAEKPHFSDLDALRFFSFMGVFLGHCFIYELSFNNSTNIRHLTSFFIRTAHNALVLFFVLSGFLITYLLLTEYAKKGRIEIFKYYKRRIVRIIPLYYLILFFIFFIYPVGSKLFFNNTPVIDVTQWKYWVFLNNFDNIKRGANIPTLSIMWSVAIEFQFYLAWPLIFLLAKKNIHWVAILMLAFSLCFRMFHYNDNAELHFNTLACMNDLATGSLLAWLLFYKKNYLEKFFARINKPVLFIFYSAFIAYLIIYAGSNYASGIEAIPDRLVISICFAFILAEQILNKASIIKLREFKLFNNLGKITYGLYCFHYLFIGLSFTILARYVNPGQFVFFVIGILTALLFTIITGKLSYRYYEGFFLRMKKY